MKNPIALESTCENTVFRKGDVFVLFGEFLGRGYASGLVDQARKAGMQSVGIAFGRRNENNALRPAGGNATRFRSCVHASIRSSNAIVEREDWINLRAAPRAP